MQQTATALKTAPTSRKDAWRGCKRPNPRQPLGKAPWNYNKCVSNQPPQQVTLMLVSLECPFPPELSGWWWRKTEEEELNVPLLVPRPADSVRTLLLRTVHLAPFLSNKSSPTKYLKANSCCNEYLNTPNTIPQTATTVKIPTQWKRAQVQSPAPSESRSQDPQRLWVFVTGGWFPLPLTLQWFPVPYPSTPAHLAAEEVFQQPLDLVKRWAGHQNGSVCMGAWGQVSHVLKKK